MEQRKLGQSDLKPSVVTFGAWAAGGWMWGGCDDKESIESIHAAIDAGINCIDTAPVYGMGHSEEVVGKAIRGRRDKVIVATKCGFRWNEGSGKTWETELPDGTKRTIRHCLKADSIREEIENSLRRLNIEAVDLYQCHAPDPGTPIAETMEALLKLKEEGKIRAIGVSNFSVEQMEESLQHAPIASSQNMYNLILRDIENDVLPFCRERNVGMLTYTPLLLGLLTGKITQDYEFPEGDLRKGHHLFTSEFRAAIAEMLKAIGPVRQNHGVTFAQLAINWLIQQEGVSTVLVGARNPKQAAENAAAADFKLAEDEIELMRQEADKVINARLKKG